MQRVLLLGVPIDPVRPSQAVDLLRGFLQGGAQHHVATPNNEMLVEAQHNAAFRSVLEATSLNLPDSSGLLFAARLTRQHLPAQVTGVDTVCALCAQLDASTPVFLLGGQEGVARAAADALRRQNPRLRIVGTLAGSPKDQDAERIIATINQAQPALLLVAFGAPAQDLWIAKHLAQMPSVRVAMGVGETFDFLSGRIKRAPKILRTLHLEWLWRLMLQPQRIGRIWNAAVVFLVLVLWNNGENTKCDMRNAKEH